MPAGMMSYDRFLGYAFTMNRDDDAMASVSPTVPGRVFGANHQMALLGIPSMCNRGFPAAQLASATAPRPFMHAQAMAHRT
jgi:hypothetical protein